MGKKDTSRSGTLVPPHLVTKKRSKHASEGAEIIALCNNCHSEKLLALQAKAKMKVPLIDGFPLSLYKFISIILP